MRNFSQQKRVLNAFLFTFAMWLVFAILFVLVFFNALFPSVPYFGISNFAYTQDAPAGAIQKGDWVFYKKGAPQEDQLFTYIINVRNSEGIAKKTLQTKLFVRLEQIEETQTVDEEEVTVTVNYYVVKTPGQEAESYVVMDEAAVVGTYLYKLPKVGYGLIYLNYNLLVSILSIVVLAVLLIVMPVLLIVKRKRLNRLPSPFYEGIDLASLSKENYYIYSELKHFFLKARMKFEKGNDCYKVYVPAGYSHKILFATIVYTNKTIRVLINRDFKRSDDRLDRSAFITIYNAVELPEVKAKINEIYKQYFKPTVQSMQNNNFGF
ncbi:MAG: hypothetical protein PHI19_03615 [Clostridia bacterium]|nr:hypothetical protein [Clostridia bacterium]